MNPFLRNTLATLSGLFLGGGLNMGLILIGAVVIPAPEGVDPNNAESIAAHIHLFEAKHFIFPFLAHAVGTMGGSILAGWISKGKLVPALVIGLFFLAGGTMMATMIPAPLWFILVDLGLAYIPMALLGWWLAKPKMLTPLK